MGEDERLFDAHTGKIIDNLKARVTELDVACSNAIGEKVQMASENARLREAIKADVDSAMMQCGGDGQGCETFRQHYGNVEHRRRKCGSCPMDTMSEIIAALQPEKADG